MFQRGRDYFRACRNCGEREEGKKEENNAIVEKSRVRTLLPPHYVKVHELVEEKDDRRQSANRRD